jgi:magnesium transporter
MKVLTIIATIFIPLTFVVGIYGMNFVNMPEINWYWGYYAGWAVMLIVVALMIFTSSTRNGCKSLNCLVNVVNFIL